MRIEIGDDALDRGLVDRGVRARVRRTHAGCGPRPRRAAGGPRGGCRHAGTARRADAVAVAEQRPPRCPGERRTKTTPATAARRICRAVTRVRLVCVAYVDLERYRQPARPAPSRAGSGRPMEKPCPYSTPSCTRSTAGSRRSRRIPRPSCSFMARASCTMALSIACERSSADHVTHEDAVDFQVRDGQCLQVGERTQAAAEVVERDVAAELTQAADQRFRANDVRDGRRLGHFERQQLAAAGLLSRSALSRKTAKSCVAERLAGNVHRKARAFRCNSGAAAGLSISIALRTTQRSMAGASW